jgi:hypothetical protein
MAASSRVLLRQRQRVLSSRFDFRVLSQPCPSRQSNLADRTANEPCCAGRRPPARNRGPCEFLAARMALSNNVDFGVLRNSRYQSVTLADGHQLANPHSALRRHLHSNRMATAVRSEPALATRLDPDLTLGHTPVCHANALVVWHRKKPEYERCRTGGARASCPGNAASADEPLAMLMSRPIP